MEAILDDLQTVSVRSGETQAPRDVLDINDCVVHENAKREREAAERHRVE